MFYLLTGEQQYLTLLTDYLDWLKNGATYTPEGLVHLDAWGANRHAGNVAFLSLWVRHPPFFIPSFPPSFCLSFHSKIPELHCYILLFLLFPFYFA